MNQFTIPEKLRLLLSKFLERIDPYLRGIVFMFFAVIIALLYDEFTSPDQSIIFLLVNASSSLFLDL